MCDVAASTLGTVVLCCLAAGVLADGGARDLTLYSNGVWRAEVGKKVSYFFSKYSGNGWLLGYWPL